MASPNLAQIMASPPGTDLFTPSSGASGAAGGVGTQYPTVQAGQSTSSGQSGQYFTDPAMVTQLASSLGGVGQDATSQYMNFVQNPTASPLYQNQLSGLLASLAPGEKQAVTGLQDMFRGAGNMSSGAYGTAAANLQGNLQQNRQTLAAQLLGQIFPQMTKALQDPMSLSEQLINALKMNQQSNVSNSQAFAPQSGGGGGGGMDNLLGSSPSNFNPLTPQQQSQAGGGGNTGVTGPNAQPASTANWYNTPYTGPGLGSQGTNQFAGQTTNLAGTGYENQGAGAPPPDYWTLSNYGQENV